MDDIMGRIGGIVRSELAGCHPWLAFIQGLVRLLPIEAGMRLRTRLYRLAGVRIGHGTIILGPLRITGTGPVAKRLVIGPDCVLNESITFNLGAPVEIEANVSIGMDCLFVTVGHTIGHSSFRAGAAVCRPIRVGRGAWIGARAIILPGATIGAGVVVAAGAVVPGDIPPDQLVGGVPARIIRALAPEESTEH